MRTFLILMRTGSSRILAGIVGSPLPGLPKPDVTLILFYANHFTQAAPNPQNPFQHCNLKQQVPPKTPSSSTQRDRMPDGAAGSGGWSRKHLEPSKKGGQSKSIKVGASLMVYLLVKLDS